MNPGGGIQEEEFWKRNRGRGILGEESGKRNPGGGILAEESWRRNPGGGILGKESWRLEAFGKKTFALLGFRGARVNTSGVPNLLITGDACF